MADTVIRLTKEKFDELSQELELLRTARRKEVAENLEYAKSLGDLSENAEYHEARAAQAQLEDRIAKLDYLLKSAAIVEGRKTGDAIGIGSAVLLRREKDGKELAYKIVGSEDGDITAGRVSADSPLAQAMAGKKAGSIFSFKTPVGASSYEILSVE
ncbi:MAG: Transcription elongation factor GreA [Parcubacteria group bacterium GW2011_GWA2_47_12]|nr:MAG: Transcription elongation factor GreA [Parcubacteria group bacterium GW2011_GWA2_47_12]